MSITFQQLRSAVPGAMPSQLDVGQLAFNVSDGTMYLGTGGNVRIDFAGAPVLPNPPAGKGWIQFLLERDALNDFFVANPVAEGAPAPQNGQVLTWNAANSRVEWQNAGTGEAYLTTNAAVVAAPGVTTTAKINAALDNPTSISQNASVIVSGNPGDTYEGLYIYIGSEWEFAAHFAFPIASEVPGTNPMTLAASNVQLILDALKTRDDALQASINANSSDISSLQGEVAEAQTDILGLQATKLDKASNTPTAGQILSFDGTGQLWINGGGGGGTTFVAGAAPITVDNTDPQNPVVGINNASTSQKGAVQLVDALNSTSTTEALTANQGYILQQQISALSFTSNLTFAGTIDASTGLMLVVSNEAAAVGFETGEPLPDPSPTNAEFYVVVTVPGTMTPPGGLAETCLQGDWWLSNGSTWTRLETGYQPPYATTTTSGIVRLATDAEVQAGTSTETVVVPSSLQSKLSDSTSTTSSTTIASSTAVKSAYDAAVQAQTTADAALPLAGGTMTGDINFVNGQAVDAGTY